MSNAASSIYTKLPRMSVGLVSSNWSLDPAWGLEALVICSFFSTLSQLWSRIGQVVSVPYQGQGLCLHLLLGHARQLQSMSTWPPLPPASTPWLQHKHRFQMWRAVPQQDISKLCLCCLPLLLSPPFQLPLSYTIGMNLLDVTHNIWYKLTYNYKRFGL